MGADTAKVPLTNAAIRAALGLSDSVLTINAGSNGPLCDAAWRAIKDHYAIDRHLDPKPNAGYLEYYDSVTREDCAEVAALLNCDAASLAVCESTTSGMNVLMWGVDLAPGDEILTTSLENIAALVPLRVLAVRRDVNLKTLNLGFGEVDVVEQYSRHVTERTRFILVSDINYATGTQFDLARLTEAAHADDVLVFVDGVQAAGTRPIDVRAAGVDGYAIARHKFLCGPAGAGALYVSPAALDRIAPTFTGALSDAGHGSTSDFVPFDGARRFEISTRALPANAGAAAATHWIRVDVGIDHVVAVVDQLALSLRTRLQDCHAVRLLTPLTAPGALTTFAVDGCDPGDVVRRLSEFGIATRPIPLHDDAGRTVPAVRISLGIWNRDSDPERIAAAVDQVVATSVRNT